MNYIDEQLERRLKVRELAEILRVDVKTVRKYYKELSGNRLGHTIMFFEKGVVDALQKRNKMGGSNE